MINPPMSGQTRVVTISGAANLAVKLSGEAIDQNSRLGRHRDESREAGGFGGMSQSLLQQGAFPSFGLCSSRRVEESLFQSRRQRFGRDCRRGEGRRIGCCRDRFGCCREWSRAQVFTFLRELLGRLRLFLLLLFSLR